MNISNEVKTRTCSVLVLGVRDWCKGSIMASLVSVDRLHARMHENWRNGYTVTESPHKHIACKGLNLYGFSTEREALRSVLEP